MKKLITLLMSAAALSGALAQGTTGEISGTVKNTKGEYLFTANVRIFNNGIFVGGAVTDIDGIYRYKPLNPGKYDVEISYTGLKTLRKKDVDVIAGKTAYADASLEVNNTLVVIIVEEEWNPPVVNREFSTIDNIKAEQIEHMPNKSTIVDIIGNVSTAIPTHDGKDVYVRGSRRGATAYIIDGQRTLGGANIPSFGIASVTLISGGVPAEYGDLSGGVVVITSKDFSFGAYEKRMMRKAYFDKQKGNKVEEKETEMEMD